MGRGGRERRIGQEIQRLLPDLLRREIKDPRVTGLVTITAVDVTADLAHAKVFVTVLGLGSQETADSTLDGLNHCASFLRSQLSHLMRVRSVPDLSFIYDHSVDRGMRLTRLIESAVSPQDDRSADGKPRSS